MKPAFLKNAVCLASLAAMASGLVSLTATAEVVAGKVVAVSHQKVTAGSQTLDKVSVTVEPCNARGTQKTMAFAPSGVHDRNALGQLFMESYQHAVMPNMEAQQISNGYGVFWVDANGTIQRSGWLGAHENCASANQFEPLFQ